MSAFEELLAAVRPPLPFSDPCFCGASAMNKDPRDRFCMCEPCPACDLPSLSKCAYCLRALGCKAHRVTIEQHVEGVCLATAEQRAEMNELFAKCATGEEMKAKATPIIEAIRAAAPKPWPSP